MIAGRAGGRRSRSVGRTRLRGDRRFPESVKGRTSHNAQTRAGRRVPRAPPRRDTECALGNSACITAAAAPNGTSGADGTPSSGCGDRW